MENYLDEGNTQILNLVLLTGLVYLIYHTWRKKKSTLRSLAKGLNARPIDSGVVGKYGSFEYILFFEEGHPGGAASGPTRVGHPSSLRVVVEKEGSTKFRILSTGEGAIPDIIRNIEQVETAVQNLFQSGFKEIEYDGSMLDIKLYPFTLDSSFNASYFTNILPAVASIVEAI